MKDKIINKELKFIEKYKKCSEKDKIIYKYGLETLYITITKILIVLIISIALKTTKEYILLLLSYSLLRMYGFGLHAKTSLGCWISTILIYIFGSLLIKHIYINSTIQLIISIISTLSILIWAPADTPKRPIIIAKNRKKLKIKSTIVSTTLMIIQFNITSTTIKNAIMLAQILEVICINPISYKITSTRYNNYKYYKGS